MAITSTKEHSVSSPDEISGLFFFVLNGTRFIHYKYRNPVRKEMENNMKYLTIKDFIKGDTAYMLKRNRGRNFC